MSGERGSGRTTQQMLNAPIGALFIWCNRHTEYARDLARLLGRTDLCIESSSVLKNYNHLRGNRYPGIVLDHALVLDADTYAAARELADKVVVRFLANA